MHSKLSEIYDKRISTCELCRVLETVLDEILEPIVLVDEEGIIKFFNKAYSSFLNVPKEKALGKLVTEVIDNTRLHIVCHDKVTEIDHVQNIKGKNAIVHRIPIFLGKEFVGAIGKVNFRDIQDVDELMQKIDVLKVKVENYRQIVNAGATYTFDDLVGQSEKSVRIKEKAKKMANTSSSVLIQGETGVGKELFAHSIHNASGRRNMPFISINCAAIPQELLEAELFGYEEGAFTGAKKSGKPGKFELADGGTVFLDEVGDMPLRMQAKLLRVLQDQQVEKVGGTEKKKVDVRVIAATNQDLGAEVKKKIFRADLYYRLSTLTLNVPPLRDRIEDIPPIVDHVLWDRNNTEGISKTFTREAIEILALYHWPGNVRELVNVVERLILMEDESVISSEHVNRALNWDIDTVVSEGSFCTLDYMMQEAEKEAILKVLRVTQGNKARAAKMLGIHRTTLYKKMQRCGININGFNESGSFPGGV